MKLDCMSLPSREVVFYSGRTESGLLLIVHVGSLERLCYAKCKRAFNFCIINNTTHKGSSISCRNSKRRHETETERGTEREKKHTTCGVSDAGCSRALMAALKSHTSIPSSCALCVSVYVCETAASVVISGSVGHSQEPIDATATGLLNSGASGN